MNNHLQNPNIDIGLAVLCASATADNTMSCADIADVCECSRNAIWKIEKRAMLKFKELAMSRGLQIFLED